MSAVVKFNFEFGPEVCCKCSIAFMVPVDFQSRCEERGDNFYCPNGHSQHYTESDISKLNKQIKKEKLRREWAESEITRQRARADTNERRRRAEKAAKTRLENRVANGVCPCCKRTFKQLAAHMKRKHPKYANGNDE